MKFKDINQIKKGSDYGKLQTLGAVYSIGFKAYVVKNKNKKYDRQIKGMEKEINKALWVMQSIGNKVLKEKNIDVYITSFPERVGEA